MTTIERMITIISWIAVVLNPIIIILTTRRQYKYNGSLEESIDKLSGHTVTYVKHNVEFLVIFIIALVYLIAK